MRELCYANFDTVHRCNTGCYNFIFGLLRHKIYFIFAQRSYIWQYLSDRLLKSNHWFLRVFSLWKISIRNVHPFSAFQMFILFKFNFFDLFEQNIWPYRVSNRDSQPSTEKLSRFWQCEMRTYEWQICAHFIWSCLNSGCWLAASISRSFQLSSRFYLSA